MLVSAPGCLEHWVYRAPKLKTRDGILRTCAGLLVAPPMMMEIAKQVLRATVRVEELSIGIEGQYFYPVAAAMIGSVHNPLHADALATAYEAVLTRYDKPVVMQKLANIYDALLTSSPMAASSASMTEIAKEEL